jgi:hypothetical protein
VRSGTGGRGSATPRRWVAKIAPVIRTAVECEYPYWVKLKVFLFIEERLSASKPFGLTKKK